MDQILDLNYSPHLPSRKETRILDFGCGTGRVLKFLSEKGYSNFIGVDTDASALNQVDPSLKQKVKRIDSLDGFLAEAGRFDVIILKDVIYYFPRVHLMAECQKLMQLLTPGGIAIVEVFNGAQLTATYTGFKDIGIQTILTETSLRQVLEGCNLEVTHVFGQENRRQSFLSALFKILRSVWHVILKVIYILERGLDSNNPKILDKSIIAIARKK